jgi:hypothetical protein
MRRGDAARPVYSTAEQFDRPVTKMRMVAARRYAKEVYKVHKTL